MPEKPTSQPVFVTRLRRPRHMHAFERELETLEGGYADAEGDPPDVSVSRLFSALESLSEAADGPPRVSAASPASRYEAPPPAEGPARREPRAEAKAAAPAEAPAPRKPRAILPLTLAPGLGAEEIRRLRRQYALDNHPDRVPAEDREEASRAMAQANAEFDRALKRAQERQ